MQAMYKATNLLDTPVAVAGIHFEPRAIRYFAFINRDIQTAINKNVLEVEQLNGVTVEQLAQNVYGGVLIGAIETGTPQIEG